MVVLLDDEIWFPDPRNGEPDGLFAVGGDYSSDRLLLAYSNGIFPWTDWRNPNIHWYCPMQRFVIFPEEIHISHSMRTLLRKQQYHITFNEDFDGVIHACAEGRTEQDGAWLGERIIEAYTRLHREGWAASVEVWDDDDRLVGGLYGVAIGASFIGESMFSRVPSGSKIALIGLARFFVANGGRMIDCQIETPHLRSMGGRYISYDQYLQILNSD